MTFPNFPKVPIDRVRVHNGDYHNDFSSPAIRDLRKQLWGRVPRHGTPDTTIPAMTSVAIACKQVVHFLSYTGRWPK